MKFVSRMFVTVLMVAFTGCGGASPSSPNRMFALTAPTEGQTLRIGDSTMVSWSCDCEGYTFVVRAFTQTGAVDISPRVAAKSASWVVGTSVDSLVLLPGLYRLELVAFVSDGGALNSYNEIWGPHITLVP